MPLGLRSHLNPEGERKMSNSAREQEPPLLVRPTHPLLRPSCHTTSPVRMFLGNWALGGRKSHELCKDSCLNLFPQRTASSGPQRQVEQLFHTQPYPTPISLALLPSKILTTVAELLIIPPISIVLGGLCLFPLSSCLGRGSVA